MCFSESNSTTSSTTIRPRSGFSMPAMHLRVMLLPEPEAPSRANVSFPASKAIFRRKLPRVFSMSTKIDIYFPPFRFSSRFTASSTTKEMARFTNTQRKAAPSSLVRQSW